MSLEYEEKEEEQETEKEEESAGEETSADSVDEAPTAEAEVEIDLPPLEDGSAQDGESDGEDSEKPSLSDVADDLPVLPLRGIVVYPMMWLPLTIGQERSIQLVEDSLPQSRIIALVTSKDESIEEPSPDQI